MILHHFKIFTYVASLKYHLFCNIKLIVSFFFKSHALHLLIVCLWISHMLPYCNWQCFHFLPSGVAIKCLKLNVIFLYVDFMCYCNVVPLTWEPFTERKEGFENGEMWLGLVGMVGSFMRGNVEWLKGVSEREILIVSGLVW